MLNDEYIARIGNWKEERNAAAAVGTYSLWWFPNGKKKEKKKEANRSAASSHRGPREKRLRIGRRRRRRRRRLRRGSTRTSVSVCSRRTEALKYVDNAFVAIYFVTPRRYCDFAGRVID